MSTTFEPATEYPIADPYDEREIVYGQRDHEGGWADHYFTDFRVPAARGGFERDDGYGEGLVTCKACQCAVRVSGEYDIPAMNVHRAWHDKVEGTR